jgi:hypothetical protein
MYHNSLQFKQIVYSYEHIKYIDIVELIPKLDNLDN